MKLLAGIILFALTVYYLFDWTFNFWLSFGSGLIVWFVYWLLIIIYYEW